MTKNILTKVRKWDENIGKLIVFAVTIIIAVGVLGTLVYFYNQSRENATNLSVLTSTTTSLDDLKEIKFCTDATTVWKVTYKPVANKYTLTCYQKNGSNYTGTINASEIKKVKGITIENCPTTANDNSVSITSWACEYKLNN